MSTVCVACVCVYVCVYVCVCVCVCVCCRCVLSVGPWYGALVLPSIHVRRLTPVSGEGAAAGGTSSAAAATGDGSTEERLVDEITLPGGVRPAPSRESLSQVGRRWWRQWFCVSSLAQAMLRHPPPHSNRVAFLAFRRWAQFTTRAASLDVDLICDLLEEKLEDDNWRARLKVSEKGGGQWERVCCVVKLCGAPMWDDGCGGRETASPSSVALNRFSAEILAACIPLTPPLVWA